MSHQLCPTVLFSINRKCALSSSYKKELQDRILSAHSPSLHLAGQVQAIGKNSQQSQGLDGHRYTWGTQRAKAAAQSVSAKMQGLDLMVACGRGVTAKRLRVGNSWGYGTTVYLDGSGYTHKHICTH